MIYTILINLHEGTKDYVTANVHSLTTGSIKELKDIAKPDNVEDYNLQWIHGLANEYKIMAREFVPSDGFIVVNTIEN